MIRQVFLINDTVFIILVDGSWSCWSSWSKCSVTCGGGHYMRTRTCSNPSPAYGGDICLGLHTEEALCNTQPCPGTHTHIHLSDQRLSVNPSQVHCSFTFVSLGPSDSTHASLIYTQHRVHTHINTHQTGSQISCHCRF